MSATMMTNETPTADEAIDDDRPSNPAREREILTAWAMRFDGYAYESVTGFRLDRGNDRYTDRGIVPRDPLRRLAVLFAMQQWLYKWGGVQNPQIGEAWQSFRRMFILTVDVDVPERYRMARWYGPWERTMRLPRDECVEFVWSQHEAAAAAAKVTIELVTSGHDGGSASRS